MTFENRLGDAFERYLAGAPINVNPSALAASIAKEPNASIWHRTIRPVGGTRLVALVAVALLIAGLIAALAFLGSNGPVLKPLGANHLLYSNGPYECQDLMEIDVLSGGARTVATCSYALLVRPDGHVAAERGPNSVVLIDLAAGTRQPVAIADGEFARPVAWSPSGRLLHWVACGSESRSCKGFIGAPSGATRNPVPEPGDSGYNGSFQWSANEQRFFLWDGAGVHVAAGDGSGFVLGAWDRLPFAIAPDARSGAFSRGRSGPGGESLNGDLNLIDALDGSQHALTGYPDGTFMQAVAWSPDGSRIALITTHRGTSASPNPAPLATLHVLARDGTEQAQINLPLPFGAMRCSEDAGVISWAPDGARILIRSAPCLEGSEPAVAPAPLVVDLQTRSQTSLIGAQQPSAGWSPDGTQVASFEFVAGGNETSVGVWDVVTGDHQSLGVIQSSEWSTLTWAP